MTITVGYIGVITVTVERDTWDDFAEAVGMDPALEVQGFSHRSASMLDAWKWAAREIARRGGTVLAPAPTATRFRVVGEATDIVPVANNNESTLDEAAAAFDTKKCELEAGLCSGWAITSRKLGFDYTWTDADGYTVRLRLMGEPEFRSLMNKIYGPMVH